MEMKLHFSSLDIRLAVGSSANDMKLKKCSIPHQYPERKAFAALPSGKGSTVRYYLGPLFMRA